MGIDPGTTTAVAVFDLQGNLPHTVSRRGFRRSAIQKFILEQGTPLLIASDITPLPRSVQKVASAFSAAKVAPEKTLGWKDKKRVVESFLKEKSPIAKPWRNAHEKDALIAGYRAWKRIRPRLDKMERKRGRKGMEETMRLSLLNGG